MKALLLTLLLMSPAMAHEGHHYFPDTPAPEMSAETYFEDYLNHGFVTGYGRPEVIMGWDIEARHNRLIVPGESQPFFQYPYNEFVTSF